MRPLHRLTVPAALLLFYANNFALADDVDHFRQFTVPPDEARILALAGVREFRCDYETMPSTSLRENGQGSEFNYQQEIMLFAELYEGTTCVGRYRLAESVNAFHDLQQPLKGIFSFGWNKERHELISVIDNGQFYRPWTASIILRDFSYCDHFFFEDSIPETRHSTTGTADFKIYPVVGVCGERALKMNESGFTDVTDFLKTCAHSYAKNALVIYLYKSQEGEDPPLHFDEASTADPAIHFFRFWLGGSLGLAVLLAVFAYLIYLFVTRRRTAARDKS